MASLDYPDQLYCGGGSAASLTVGQLAYHLAALVRTDEILQDLWVRGEISNITRAGSGHIYFSLKDDTACIGCVMWRSSAQWLLFQPEPGMQLLAHGQVDVYAPRGQYQLVVDQLEPDGRGAVFLALEQAKARLTAEGLLDTGRKRPLPAFPRRVAVVTSLQGAAVRDICVTLERDGRPPEIVLVPALVQGEGADVGICKAIRLANHSSGADLLIVSRGGGSVEDLWSFNSEMVARAIAASRLPVISAVGHETDFTLADMAADVRAATPTAAAELVLALRAEARRRAEAAARRARELLAARIENARVVLDSMRRRHALSRPASMVETRRQRLDDLSDRLNRAAELCFSRRRHRLALAAGKLDAVSPLATLARGYASVTRQRDHAPVTRTGDVAPGENLEIRVLDGTVEAWVTAVQREEREETGEGKWRKRKRN